MGFKKQQKFISTDSIRRKRRRDSGRDREGRGERKGYWNNRRIERWEGFRASPRIDSKDSLRILLAGRYDNPIPARFLAPIDCLKKAKRKGERGERDHEKICSRNELCMRRDLPGRKGSRLTGATIFTLENMSKFSSLYQNMYSSRNLEPFLVLQRPKLT